ncbi:MAG: hypothetical protein J6L24_04400 [Oscillospiraceae bacterium]|nr:hypothetical protein [Oscillospiraceae bacterium]
MKGNEFLDKMELIDPAYVEAADINPKRKRNALLKWGAMVACLGFVVGAITMIPRFSDNQVDPQPGEIVLSDKTTAKVSYGYDDSEATSTKGELEYLTEEEMFAHENKYVFRGTVSGLTNVTIDFNGEKEVRCIATIVINEVYQGQGDLAVGEQITMLIPCAIDLIGNAVEDTGVIAQLRSGMEGIFMPWVYDENSYIEMNGAVLMKQDLAACGLADGMRWAFLATDQGLVFLRSAYPGAKDATNLDDIEAYVIEMLK